MSAAPPTTTALRLHRQLNPIWATGPGLQRFAAVNHSVIGVRMMITSFAFFAIAGILGMLVRVQLATPNAMRGRVGAVNRDGQANSTAACGALMRFRGELAEGRVHSGLDQYDLEMSLVRQRLLRAVTYGRVPDVVEITTIARDVILEDLVHTAERVPGWCEADVAVFSGIQIHTRDGDMVAPGRSFLRQAGVDTEVPLEI